MGRESGPRAIADYQRLARAGAVRWSGWARIGQRGLNLSLSALAERSCASAPGHGRAVPRPQGQSTIHFGQRAPPATSPSPPARRDSPHLHSLSSLPTGLALPLVARPRPSIRNRTPARHDQWQADPQGHDLRPGPPSSSRLALSLSSKTAPLAHRPRPQLPPSRSPSHRRPARTALSSTSHHGSRPSWPWRRSWWPTGWTAARSARPSWSTRSSRSGPSRPRSSSKILPGSTSAVERQLSGRVLLLQSESMADQQSRARTRAHATASGPKYYASSTTATATSDACPDGHQRWPRRLEPITSASCHVTSVGLLVVGAPGRVGDAARGLGQKHLHHFARRGRPVHDVGRRRRRRNYTCRRPGSAAPLWKRLGGSDRRRDHDSAFHTRPRGIPGPGDRQDEAETTESRRNDARDEDSKPERLTG